MNGNMTHECKGEGCGCGKLGKFSSNYLQLNIVGDGGKPVLRRSPIVTC
jgi:hypothetical protein